MNMLSVLVSLFQNAAYLGCMLYLAGGIRHRRKHLHIPLLLISYLLFSGSMSLIQLYDNNWIILGTLLSILLYIAFMYVNTGQGLNQSLHYIFCGYITASLCQVLMMLLLTLAHQSMDINNASDPGTIFVIVGSVIPLIPILHFLPWHAWMQWLAQFSYSTTLGFIGILLLLSCISLTNTQLKLGLLVSTGVTILILILSMAITLYHALAAQKRRQAIRDYETYLPILDEMIQSIQKQQHLYNNKIASIVHLTDLHTDYNSLCAALNAFRTVPSEQDHEAYAFLHLTNKLLAGLLYCKCQEAKQADQKITVLVNNFHYQSRCNDTEIVDLTGILLDNALEASAPGDTIYVTIGRPEASDTKFYLCVENPGPVVTDAFLHTIFTPHITSKANKNGHGLGLPILKGLVNKYHGTLTVSNSQPVPGSGQAYISFEIEI